MYLSLIVLCVILYCVFPNKTNKYAIKQYIYIVTCLLIVVSGLRHEAVGNDTYAYMQSFDKMYMLSWDDILGNFWQSYLYPGIDGNGKDPGQLVVMKALSLVLPDSRFFFFLLAIVLLVPLGIFIYRNSESLETSCFSYVFYITMFYPYLPNSAVRQSFALSVLLIGYLYLQKGKDKYFIAIDDGIKGKYYNFIVDHEGLNFELNTGYIVTFRFYITAEDGSYQPVTTSNNVVPVIRVE